MMIFLHRDDRAGTGPAAGRSSNNKQSPEKMCSVHTPLFLQSKLSRQMHKDAEDFKENTEEALEEEEQQTTGVADCLISASMQA